MLERLRSGSWTEQEDQPSKVPLPERPMNRLRSGGSLERHMGHSHSEEGQDRTKDRPRSLTQIHMWCDVHLFAGKALCWMTEEGSEADAKGQARGTKLRPSLHRLCLSDSAGRPVGPISWVSIA